MIYSFDGYDLLIFSSAEAAAGFSEPFDVEAGSYALTFDGEGRRVVFEMVDWRPPPRFGLFGRRLGRRPAARVLTDEPADPDRLAMKLTELLVYHGISPSANGLAALRTQAEEVYGIVR